MARRLTEREAWLYLARVWRCKPKPKPFDWCEGLCSCIDVLHAMSRISDGTYAAMNVKLTAYAPNAIGLPGWRWTKGLRKPRLSFCREMASKCPKPKKVKAGK